MSREGNAQAGESRVTRIKTVVRWNLIPNPRKPGSARTLSGKCIKERIAAASKSKVV